jgi:hypothetical protein
MVDLLFRNREHLTEIALNRRLHDTVSLNGLQVPRTQDDEGSGRQNDGQMQDQYQPHARTC